MKPFSFDPCVLLFNIAQNERCAKIEMYLKRQGIRFLHVPPEDFGRQLGSLLSLPGFEARASAAVLPFSEEILVMSGFDQRLLQSFLNFFSSEGIKRVALKAMLTPTNASWTAAELHRNLRAEHEQFQKLKK